jgi:hypothetical protein
MTNFEDKLSAALYRATCPDSIELGEYYLGILGKDRSDLVRLHLAECPHCTLELTQLESFAGETALDLEPTMAERVKVWIAQFVPEVADSDPGIEPALALRGDDQGPLVYEAGEAQLTIEIQDDPDELGRRTLLGLVMGVEPEDIQVHLYLDGERVVSAEVDELGNFIISDLSPGHYEMILATPTVEIHVQDLAV